MLFPTVSLSQNHKSIGAAYENPAKTSSASRTLAVSVPFPV